MKNQYTHTHTIDLPIQKKKLQVDSFGQETHTNNTTSQLIMQTPRQLPLEDILLNLLHEDSNTASIPDSTLANSLTCEPVWLLWALLDLLTSSSYTSSIERAATRVTVAAKAKVVNVLCEALALKVRGKTKQVVFAEFAGTGRCFIPHARHS